MSWKQSLSAAALTAVMGVGALALSAGNAAAYVACNDEGDCWHTDQQYQYPGTVQFHPDDWYFHHDWDHDRDHHWRGYHDGRGYWHGGVWVPF